MKQIINAVLQTVRASGRRMAALAAGFALAGALAVPGVVSAQSAVPTSRADCANWQSYSSPSFSSRADCINFVNANNANDNGYGGGNNGGGIDFANFLSRLFGFIGQLFQLIASFFGRLF